MPDFESQEELVIIKNLPKKGMLHSVIHKYQKGNADIDYSNSKQQIILIGVERGIKCSHDRGIAHNGICPYNILLDEKYHPHISDFKNSILEEELSSVEDGEHIFP